MNAKVVKMPRRYIVDRASDKRLSANFRGLGLWRGKKVMRAFDTWYVFLESPHLKAKSKVAPRALVFKALPLPTPSRSMRG